MEERVLVEKYKCEREINTKAIPRQYAYDVVWSIMVYFQEKGKVSCDRIKVTHLAVLTIFYLYGRRWGNFQSFRRIALAYYMGTILYGCIVILSG